MLERGHDVDEQVIVGAVLVGGRESSEIPVSVGARGAQFILDTRGSVGAREGTQARGRRRRGWGGGGGE